jgi:hypothetical protein
MKEQKMSRTEFNLTIKLANSEMSGAEHVAAALRDLADRVDLGGVAKGSGYTVRDVNGNEVGKATVDKIGGRQDYAFTQQVGKVGNAEAKSALVKIATVLGSYSEWNGGDVCESVAQIINDETSLPSVSDQGYEEHEHWATIADDLGWDHDFEPEEYDEDAANTDAEMDAREEW